MLVSSLLSTRERSSDRAHFEILNAKHRYKRILECDFDSTVSAEGGRKKKREKKNLESDIALHPHNPLPTGDSFSLHGVKKCLPPCGEKERGDVAEPFFIF
ncbi:hypothetical protein BHM03_00014330 [Ensete ventricosum]|nr:hypothetical protein BHM03_00014330 [Ensete ventricosum]